MGSAVAPALPVGVRAWTVRDKPATGSPTNAGRSTYVLVVDTETTVDVGQALLYGGYRFGEQGPAGLVWLEEGLLFADDLAERDPAGLETLQAYVRDQLAETDAADVRSARGLRLYSRRQFTDRVLWRGAYQARAVVVMFNAPFDWSRIAVGAGLGIERFAGGFSLRIYDREQYRFRVSIKSLDSKRAIKSFTAPAEIDREDLLDLAEGKKTFPGHLLDLRTLVFALTNGSHTLASACEAFGVQHGKIKAPPHGVITTAHIDYCRRDVLATAELYEKAMADFGQHPIAMSATQVYSPATLAKANLRAMNLKPVLRRQPDFSPEVLGQAMSAFYGGRAEVHHRRDALPVQLVDFTSMYPTVVALMKIWGLLIADRVETVEATEDVQRLLDRVSLDRCLSPDLWSDLVGIAQIIPSGDVLPTRARYGDEPGYTIGVNPFTDDRPHWYAVADLIASTLLTGTAPRVLAAVRFERRGVQPGLRSVKLRGEHDLDPYTEDPFKFATELRQRLKGTGPQDHNDRCACPECQRLNFLKVFANSGSYGIFARSTARSWSARPPKR